MCGGCWARQRSGLPCEASFRNGSKPWAPLPPGPRTRQGRRKTNEQILSARGCSHPRSGQTLLAGNGWPPSFLWARLRYLPFHMDPEPSDTPISGPFCTRWVRPPLPLPQRLPTRFRPVHPGCGPPLRRLNQDGSN